MAHLSQYPYMKTCEHTNVVDTLGNCQACDYFNRPAFDYDTGLVCQSIINLFQFDELRF